MLKSIAQIKVFGIYLFSLALVLAGCFGYRCPAQGCPACRLIGH